MLSDTPVDAIQTDAEFWPLLDLYRQRKPMSTLEIGTFKGGTFYHWLRNAPPGATVVSVDLYEDANNSALYDEWAAPGVEWALAVGDSNDPETARQAAYYAPFEWIFVDAGHLEENIRADWALYSPLAAPGAIIAFHDITECEDRFPRIQVARLWRELKTQFKTAEFAVGEQGGGIGVVFLP